MHLITRPYIIVESFIYGLFMHSPKNKFIVQVTYIDLISKRSTSTLQTVHALPKEVNQIWFHVVIFRPLQHSKKLRLLLTVDNINFYYNFKPEGEHEYTLV